MRIHVGDEFYVHNIAMFVIDYVYICEFADSYETSLVFGLHIQGGCGSEIIDVLTMCL